MAVYRVNHRKKGNAVRTRGIRFGLTAVLITTFIISGCLSGCGMDENAAAESVQTEYTGETVVFTDDCGRDVEVPEQISAVIGSGNLAEIFLFAIDPDAMMAVAGNWSEDAAQYVDEKYLNLQEVGSFFGNHDLNYEEIAKIRPQIIIDVGEAKPSMKADLDDITAKTGIPAVHIDAYYDTMDEAFEKLGVLLGREVEGNELAAFCKDAYDSATRIAAEAEQNGGKKTLLYCTQEDGQNVLAKGSYHAEIIDMLSDNLAVLDDPSSEGSGNEVNLEQMMLWDPEVILFAPNGYYNYTAEDPAWQILTAIQNDTYYEVPSGPYNWMGSPPSSNRVLGMLWLADLLYPELTDYDLKEQTIRYYQLFYHCNLTEEQYEELVEHSITKRKE